MANEFIARKGLIALNNTQITGSLSVSSTLSIPGFTNVSASLAAAVAGGDNLGNHTATQDLDLGGNDIINIGNITASGNISASGAITGSDVYINDWGSVSASLAAAGGGSGDNLGNHTATQNLNMDSYPITNVTSITGSNSAAIEIGDYNFGYEVTTGFPVTGSGIIIRKSGIPANNHPMLKIGDVELMDITPVFESPAFLIRNVDRFLVTSGSEPANIYGDFSTKLFEHDGDAFKINIGGDTSPVFTLDSASGLVVNTSLTAQRINAGASEGTISYMAGWTGIPSTPTSEIKYQSLDTAVSASAAASGFSSGDNLGNHTATQDLNLDSNNIINVTNITASANISASGDLHSSRLFLPQGNGTFDSGLVFGVASGDSGYIYDDGNKIQIGYNDADIIAIQDTTDNVSIVGNLNVSSDITGSDVKIDGWGSVSASLAAAGGGGGGGATVSLITSIGGRLQITTGTDAGEDNTGLAGALGAHYYVWSTTTFLSSNAVASGIGTPGTSTFTGGIGYSIVNGLFRVLEGGTIAIAGNIEWDSNAEVQGEDMRIFVWKIDSSEISALANGTYDSSWSGVLVASTSVTCPAASQNIIPMSFISTNGVSVSAGDMVFATAVFDGTVTGTRYFPINYQLYVTV